MLLFRFFPSRSLDYYAHQPQRASTKPTGRRRRASQFKHYAKAPLAQAKKKHTQLQWVGSRHTEGGEGCCVMAAQSARLATASRPSERFHSFDETRPHFSPQTDWVATCPATPRDRETDPRRAIQAQELSDVAAGFLLATRQRCGPDTKGSPHSHPPAVLPTYLQTEPPRSNPAD